jgi:hypothetical protein
MEKNIKEKIYIRRSVKFDPIIRQIEKIASERSGGQLTSTLLEMAALGVKVYESGLRLVDNELIQINNENTITMMNVDREVGRSIFPSFVGAIADMKRFEKNKLNPDPEKINFYQLVAKALASQYANFSKFSDADVDQVFNEIAPILKACNLAKTDNAREQIINLNKQIFLNLIDKTGVVL